MAEQRRRASTGKRAPARKKNKPFPTRGTAPSAPDISKLHLLEVSKEAKAHIPSEVDAMGQDKRRAVIGHSYGPSTGRQLLFYGLAVGMIALLVIGGVVLTGKFDKGPATDAAKAPWAQPGAPQTPAVRPQ